MSYSRIVGGCFAVIIAFYAFNLGVIPSARADESHGCEILRSRHSEYGPVDEGWGVRWSFTAISSCEDYSPRRLFPGTKGLQSFLDTFEEDAPVFDYHLTLVNDSSRKTLFSFADPNLANSPFLYLAHGPSYEVPACSKVLFWFLSPSSPVFRYAAMPMYVVGTDGLWVPLGGKVSVFVPNDGARSRYYETGVFVFKLSQDQRRSHGCLHMPKMKPAE